MSLQTTDSPTSDTRFYELAMRYLDGVDDPASHDELSQMCRDHAHLRRRFRELCHLTMSLDERSHSEPVAPLEPIMSSRSRGTMVWRAVAAVLVVGVFVAWLAAVWNRADEPEARPTPLGPVVAVVQSDEDAVWAGEPMHSGQEVRTDEIRIESGVVEFEFRSGAVVRLTGPAVFRPQSLDSARLTLGTVEARVVGDGGFRVLGPRFSVVDLGTEFGVHVDPDGAGEVLVFDGSVELRAGSNVMTLKAGEGSRVAPGGDVTYLPDQGAKIRKESTVYLENFANPAPVDRPLEEAGWRIHKTGGREADQPVLSYAPNASPEPVASQPPANPLTDAFMLTLDTEAGVDYLYWTDEFTLDASRWRATRFAWIERHDHAEQATRFAIRVGSHWYVSQLLEPATREGGAWRRSVRVADCEWRRLRFEPGEELEVGDIASPAQEDITAFGVFVERRVGYKLRFDSIQIDAAPAVWWSLPE